MSDENRETVADIVADIRKIATTYAGYAAKSEGVLRESFQLQAENHNIIADRIEAAAKRMEQGYLDQIRKVE